MAIKINFIDRLTKEQPRRNMQNVKNKDLQIELKLRRELWKKGFRYRKNVREIFGCPDIVFNLYCKIPFQSSSKNNPEVMKIAKIIGRSSSAVNMKIGNFGSFDENLNKKGIVVLKNASKHKKVLRHLSKDFFN